MNYAEFQDLVQDCFDRRIDPLDEARVARYLDAHPEALEAFAAQRQWLSALPARPSAVLRRQPFWPWLAAAALLLAGVAVLRTAPGNQPIPPRSPVIDTARLRILESSLSEQTSLCGATLTWRAREVLLDTPTTRLEIVEQGSIRR